MDIKHVFYMNRPMYNKAINNINPIYYDVMILVWSKIHKQETILILLDMFQLASRDKLAVSYIAVLSLHEHTH